MIIEPGSQPLPNLERHQDPLNPPHVARLYFFERRIK